MQKVTLPMVIAFILMGCTIMQMQKEIDATEERIARKEARLSDLEAEKERLEQHQALLVEKLDRAGLTCQQLNSELDQLIRQNRQVKTLTEKQGQDAEEIRKEIEVLEAKQASLSQMAASDDSDAAKQQKILALQQEIRNYLLLGLKAKHRKTLK